MAIKNYYQILNVHREAPQAVIEAAYQRLLRIHGAATANPHLDQRMQEIEEAYTVLRSPLRRKNYDAEWTAWQNGSGSKRRNGVSLQKPEEVDAWLSYQQHTDHEEIVFRIGWAADFGITVKALQSRIPVSDRHYDPASHEWRIGLRYEPVLKDLFDNYEAIDDPPPQELPRPIYPRRPPPPRKRNWQQAAQGWLVVILVVALLAVLGDQLLRPGNRENNRLAAVDIAATATSRIKLTRQAITPFPTATPLPTVPVTLDASPRYASVHVRTGPGTEYDSLGYIFQGQTYPVVGRTADQSWVVVSTDETVGWSAEWTLTINGDVSTLAVYAADAPLPETLPTATPAAEATPTP